MKSVRNNKLECCINYAEMYNVLWYIYSVIHKKLHNLTSQMYPLLAPIVISL